MIALGIEASSIVAAADGCRYYTWNHMLQSAIDCFPCELAKVVPVSPPSFLSLGRLPLHIAHNICQVPTCTRSRNPPQPQHGRACEPSGIAMGRTVWGEQQVYVPLDALLISPGQSVPCMLIYSVDPWKDENKSGLHPQYPDIDVRYPDTLSPEAWVNLRLRLGGLLQPSDPELDRLFLDETYQFGEICGYTVCV